MLVDGDVMCPMEGAAELTAPAGDVAGTDHAGPMVLGRGAQVGRYVVVHPLGRGGMGVVYLAYDPELDRRVAIKLIDARGRSPEKQALARARLLREAQSLARLSHPAVVTVLDVGTFEDRVFVAMEYVDGPTLSQWITRERPNWRQVLAVLRRAGTGLEAAHLAGLVHRDFKPDNIMIRSDGRVVVLDFGLARFTAGEDGAASGVRPGTALEDTDSDVVPDARRSSSSLSHSLTQPGRVMGTPAYMAPEQHLGLPTDARSDQFSFCVTLYEALYGERPFGHGSSANLAFKIGQGQIQPPRRSAKVPRWLRRVAVRGLAADPEDRHPSMTALLHVLARDPGRKRWTVLAGGVLLSASAGAYVALAGQSAQMSACGGGEQRLAPIWNESRRNAIAQAFAATGKSFADDTARRVTESIEKYSRHWLTSHRDACEATAVHHEQSEAVLDLRMRCLDRDLEQLSAVVEVLSESDVEVLAQAVDAVGELPNPDHCADIDALRRGDRVPRPVDRDAADAFERQFARAKALRDLGGHKDASSAVHEVVQAARRLAHAPSITRALLLAASIQQEDHQWDQMETTLRQAMMSADRAHDDSLRAQAMISLAELEAQRSPSSPAATEWAQAAGAVIHRVGSPPYLRAALEEVHGATARERGDMKTAAEHYATALAMYEAHAEASDPILPKTLLNLANVQVRSGQLEESRKNTLRALKLQEAYYGPDHPQLSRTINLLASIDVESGRSEEGLAGFRRVLALDRDRYGESHPQVARALNNMGVAFGRLQRLEESLDALLQSLSIMETVLGPNDVELWPRVENLGNAYMQVRQFDKGRGYLQRALSIKLAHLGEDHPEVGVTLSNLARGAFLEGNYEEAERRYQRALAIWRAKDRPNDLHYLTVYAMMGDLEFARGHYQKALRSYQESLGIAVQIVGKDHPAYAYSLAGVGMASARTGEQRAGIAMLQQALALQRKMLSGRGWIERTMFALARELSATDPTGATSLAREARASLRETLPGSRELQAVDRWLARHVK